MSEVEHLLIIYYYLFMPIAYIHGELWPFNFLFLKLFI